MAFHTRLDDSLEFEMDSVYNLSAEWYTSQFEHGGTFGYRMRKQRRIVKVLFIVGSLKEERRAQGSDVEIADPDSRIEKLFAAKNLPPAGPFNFSSQYTLSGLQM